MTDIMNSPAVKQVMKQPGHVSADGAAQGQGEQPIRAAVVRAAELARDAESNARTRQHAKGKMTARERLGLLLDTGSFEEIGRFRGGDINGGKAGSAVITGFGDVYQRSDQRKRAVNFQHPRIIICHQETYFVLIAFHQFGCLPLVRDFFYIFHKDKPCTYFTISLQPKVLPGNNRSGSPTSLLYIHQVTPPELAQ